MSLWCASIDAAAHVFVPMDALSADEIEISGDDGRHLSRVRRIGVGEVISVADGAGLWRVTEVASVTNSSVMLSPTTEMYIEPFATPRLTVAFAPAKGDQPESVVASLTELGVDVIIPVITKRTVLKWTGERAEKAGDRLRRVARSASEQSRRARLPEVMDPQPLTRLAGSSGLVVASRDGGSVESLKDPGPSGWILLIGPEGGLEAGETASLGEVESLCVGPHILRSATAPIAAAGMIWARRA
ncbi:MAG: 16S rRNA (uracil(1498)-N(3))-methyltransferase [Acidimicrobiia bacterium]|nr:16S rRNA (uracil(1498)-N(3))-methyltransferase [Acidimicrobiia bacterium]